jgi:SAM-dependent methyltransferase
MLPRMSFRAELYGRYVSAFKGRDAVLEGAALASFRAWWWHRLGALLADLPRDARILELGCGAGHVLQLLGEHGFTRVEGVDISAEQVELAVARGISARVADACELLAAHDGEYAAILAFDFIEHFDRSELLELSAAIWRALAPGGRFLLQTPNGEGLMPGQVIYGDLTHLTIFTPGSLEQLLRFTGFTDFEFMESGPAPLGLRGHLRVLAWKLVKRLAGVVRRIETGKRQAIWTETMFCRCRKGA